MLDQKKTVLLANLALLTTAIIWGGGFIAGKMALSGYTPLTLLAFRFSAAAFFIGILFFRTISLSTKKAIKSGLFLGLIQFCGMVMQTVGLRMTTPGKQAFLVSSYVVFVPLLSWLVLRRTPLKKELFAAFLAIIGLACISLNESLTIGTGDLLSIGFAIAFGFQIVMTDRYSKGSNPICVTFFQCLCAGVLSLICAFSIEGTPHITWGTPFWGIVYLVLCNTVLALLLQNIGQRYTSGTAASILFSLESVFGFVFSVLLLQETVTPKILFGCALVFFAALFSKLQFRSSHAAATDSALQQAARLEEEADTAASKHATQH